MRCVAIAVLVASLVAAGCATDIDGSDAGGAMDPPASDSAPEAADDPTGDPADEPGTSDTTAAGTAPAIVTAELRAAVEELAATCPTVDADRLGDLLPPGHRRTDDDAAVEERAATTITSFEVEEATEDRTLVEVTLGAGDDEVIEVAQAVELTRDDDGVWRLVTAIECPSGDVRFPVAIEQR